MNLAIIIVILSRLKYGTRVFGYFFYGFFLLFRGIVYLLVLIGRHRVGGLFFLGILFNGSTERIVISQFCDELLTTKIFSYYQSEV